MSWTAERVELVRELAISPDKLSAAEIGVRVHASRNAVIGMCSRRGISLPNRVGQWKRRRSEGEVIKARAHAPKVTPRKFNTERKFNTPRPQPATVEYTPREAKDTKSLFITFANLASHHCRYPFGGDLPDNDPITYCGQRKEDESPYCPAHAQLCYTPRKRAA